ncbi:MAG TPA: tryptophan synthase subunit alpha, partial [Dehalococcoidia bacterium]|nr:tryptophan synthase subunit alpha [Dehalococcoidia bacterium]
MSRIDEAFARARAEGRIALMPFIVAGHPSPDATPGLVRTLFEAGADVIELGVPFSDPLADGATNQRANEVALRHGMTLARCLDIIREARAGGVTGAIALMGYYNPILAYDLDRFVPDAAAAGADGLIVVDLPPEESDDLRERCQAHGLDLIYLLAPTSSEQRIALVAKRASGFVYCVSVAGVTGARDRLPDE